MNITKTARETETDIHSYYNFAIILRFTAYIALTKAIKETPTLDYF